MRESSVVFCYSRTCNSLEVNDVLTADFSFVAYKQSTVAVAAIIVTLEQLNTAPDNVCKWLFIVNANHDYKEDPETLACVKRLRKIFIHNQNRIKELDGSGSGNDVITIPKEKHYKNKRICRVATPSPTPEDEPEVKKVGNQEVFINDDRDIRKKSILLPTPTRDEDCIDYNDIDSGQRKRKRCAVSNKCTIN